MSSVKDLSLDYILISAANDCNGDKVPLVRIILRHPSSMRDLIATPELKHQKLKVRPEPIEV
jgi:hypothetical protein